MTNLLYAMGDKHKIKYCNLEPLTKPQNHFDERQETDYQLWDTADGDSRYLPDAMEYCLK